MPKEFASVSVWMKERLALDAVTHGLSTSTRSGRLDRYVLRVERLKRSLSNLGNFDAHLGMGFSQKTSSPRYTMTEQKFCQVKDSVVTLTA